MRRVLRVEETAERIRKLLREDPRGPHGAVLSCRELARRWETSYSTVQRAIALLAREGLLRPERGRGTLRSPSAATSTLQPRPMDPACNPPPEFPRRIWALAVDGTAGPILEPSYGSLLYQRLTRSLLTVGDHSAPGAGLPQPEDFLRLGVSGVLLFGFTDPEFQERWARACLPAVLLDDTPVVRGLDHVVADNRAGAEAIVRRLVRWGHRRFAFVRSVIRPGGVLRPDSDSLERERFVRAALRRHGLDLPPAAVIDNRGGRTRTREPAAHRFLALRPRPTAVIASGEDRAITLYRILRQQGVAVPDEVSVAAFCGAGDAPVRIAGAEIDFEALAQLGFERLRARAAGRVLPGRSRRLLAPVSLRDGETWGPAPGT